MFSSPLIILASVELLVALYFWELFFSHVDGSERSPDDLIIRCGEYDLRNDTIEKYPNQDRYVETFSIDPFYTGSEGKGNTFLWHDVASPSR